MGGNKGGIEEAGISGQAGTRKTQEEDERRWQACHL
jgi:hypothetical protein